MNSTTTDANAHLLIERRGPALWLIINREARRNAISSDVLSGISRGLDIAEANSDIRCVVLTGAGRKAFCAGGDLQTSDPFVIDPLNPYVAAADLFRKAHRSTVPLVARVNGACFAGGMGLMAMCDLAVATETARFSLPEVRVGVFPAQVLSVLQHLLPRRALVEMCLTGEPISAVKAMELSLVNAVHVDVDVALEELMSRLLKGSPSAIKRGLYTLKKMERMSFEESAAFAESQIALFALTDDAKEGVKAFMDKRVPRWCAKGGDEDV
ncbi:MAG TPA: enoyl-CoA hydratase [Pusillimonas sp.]|jgi:enoyl-CoA hydratase/carnithine racemase|nr:enoyl-CoA hydratase [Pusillimonas sp.]|tara:strand:- start:7538 stop:8344 length:807 start_codon:yes stop_codon:yes gene_type:complete